MPTHAEKRHLPFTKAQLFDLVADVERYPEFLPWCTALRVRKREGDLLTADMMIGFKMFRERFTSKVTLTRPDRVDVAYTQGPFKYLNNHWVFEEAPEGDEHGPGTYIDFFIDFEFRTPILQKMIGEVFNKAVGVMVHAFEKRAHALYDPKPEGEGKEPKPPTSSAADIEAS